MLLLLTVSIADSHEAFQVGSCLTAEQVANSFYEALSLQCSLFLFGRSREEPFALSQIGFRE